MAKVITFSRHFPAYHPKAGQPTWFVEKFWKALFNLGQLQFMHYENGYRSVFPATYKDVRENIHQHKPKYTTIRKGHRFKAGDYFSPRVWGNNVNKTSGRSGPYQSDQVIIGPETLVEKIYDFKIIGDGSLILNGKQLFGETELDFEIIEQVAENDGLDRHDLMDWFKYPKPFDGQIICINPQIKY